MEIVRASGITTTQRRCSEFRQLLSDLKDELPQHTYPSLPAKKLYFQKVNTCRNHANITARMQELQRFIDYLLDLKIYSEHLHKFLMPNRKIPFYKLRPEAETLAPPNPSTVSPAEQSLLNPSITESAVLNMDKLKHATESTLEPEMVKIEGSGIGSTIFLDPAAAIQRATEVEKLVGTLAENMNFTAEMSGIKEYNGKMVRLCDYSVVLYVQS